MEVASDVPVLSFPAILRNPGLTNRYAHLHGSTPTGIPNNQSLARTSYKKNHKDQNEGKRWIRRKDNCQRSHLIDCSSPCHLIFPVSSSIRRESTYRNCLQARLHHPTPSNAFYISRTSAILYSAQCQASHNSFSSDDRPSLCECRPFLSQFERNAQGLAKGGRSRRSTCQGR